MARKNLFLTLSLFVMVAALIGGILWSRPDEAVVHDSSLSGSLEPAETEVPMPSVADASERDGADVRRAEVPLLAGAADADATRDSAAASTPAECRIAGVVVDEGGRPLANVQVQVRAGGDGANAFLLAGIGRNAPPNSATTGGDGRFSLTVAPGSHHLTTATSGWLPVTRTVEVESGRDVTDLVLTLAAGAVARGLVLDDVGKPIAGARVAPFRESKVGPSMQIERVVDAEAAITDASGHFELGGLEAGRAARLRASADRHAALVQQHDAIGGGELVFRLKRLGSVRGILVDATGTPIGGTTIALEGNEAPVLRRDDSDTVSATDGTFEIVDVTPGTWTVVAEAAAGHREARSLPVEVRPGERAPEVRLVVEAGATVEVVVLDADNRPVADAEVRVARATDDASRGTNGAVPISRRIMRTERAGSGSAPRVFDSSRPVTLAVEHTDAEGRVTIGGLPGGQVELTAEHDDYAPSRTVRLELPRAGAVEAQLTLRASGAAKVTVFDVDGVEQKGAELVVTGPAGESSTRRTGRTPEHGGVSFASLLPGAYTAALAKPGGGVEVAEGVAFSFGGDETPTRDDSLVHFEVVAGSETEVVIHAPALARVHGVVRDASGPVVGAVVRLRSPDSMEALPAEMFGGGKMARTGEDGGFVFEGVASGDYELRYGRPDALVQHEHAFTIAALQREVEVALELAGGEVVVTVLDDQGGQPVRGARVTFERVRETAGAAGDGRPRRTMAISFATRESGGGGETVRMNFGGPGSIETDEHGVARAVDVPRGQYRIKVESDEHAAATVADVEVRPSEVTTPAPVRLRAAGTLVGTVTGFAADEPMQIAMVEVTKLGDAGSATPRTEIALEGKLRISGLEPGRYSARARHASAQEFGPAVEVEIEAGQQARVELELR